MSGQRNDSRGHAHLDGVLVGKKMNYFECMCDNSDCHELLAVIASLHHQTGRPESINCLKSEAICSTCQLISQL